MTQLLTIDIGSTYTKVAVFDIDEGRLLGISRAHTTVDTDITQGIERAVRGLIKRQIDPEKISTRLACSSAAGGLKMVAIGLVPELTTEAARRAALGAGAKVQKVFAYELTSTDLAEMVTLDPDLILLAGGTDGGNQKVLLHNAHALARSGMGMPVIVAGNKSAATEVERILRSSSLDPRITENVMPQLDTLNIKPARQTIRQVFLEKIVQAKGLDRVQKDVDNPILPTPAAVLRAAQLLADGTKTETGLGELILVDVGGATTDVYSIAQGQPSQSGITVRGLPEPYAKRTVEGDLGMRWSAQTLYETVGNKELTALLQKLGMKMTQKEIERRICELLTHPNSLPQNVEDEIFDLALGRIAVTTAFQRHVGYLEEVYTPFGRNYVQYGKDLRETQIVIGTGGVLTNQSEPQKMLAGVLYTEKQPTLLAPQNPQFWLDRAYILAAIGLIGEKDPTLALQIAKQYIQPI